MNKFIFFTCSLLFFVHVLSLNSKKEKTEIKQNKNPTKTHKMEEKKWLPERVGADRLKETMFNHIIQREKEKEIWKINDLEKQHKLRFQRMEMNQLHQKTDFFQQLYLSNQNQNQKIKIPTRLERPIENFNLGNLQPLEPQQFLPQKFIERKEEIIEKQKVDFMKNIISQKLSQKQKEEGHETPFSPCGNVLDDETCKRKRTKEDKKDENRKRVAIKDFQEKMKEIEQEISRETNQLLFSYRVKKVRRNICCESERDCCYQAILNPNGEKYSVLLRRLERRTRKLIRDIDHRREERNLHKRTRDLLRRTFKRIQEQLKSIE